jgi:hypothetical protein
MSHPLSQLIAIASDVERTMVPLHSIKLFTVISSLLLPLQRRSY